MACKASSISNVVRIVLKLDISRGRAASTLRLDRLRTHTKELGILYREEKHNCGVQNQENNYNQCGVFATKFIGVDVTAFIFRPIEIVIRKLFKKINERLLRYTVISKGMMVRIYSYM